MTGVLAHLGSFFHTYLAIPVAHAAEEGGSGVHVVLKAEEVFSLFGFPITNSQIMSLIVLALLVAFAFWFRRTLSLVPGKLQAGIEWVFEGVVDYMTETLESEKMARRFFPLIMSIFLFVCLANLLALLPGVGSIGFTHDGYFTPLFRAPAADLNATLALAFISFFTIEVTGLAALGVVKYGSKYVNFTSISGAFVGIIEFLSNLGRIISFSFRLFGNIFAGEVMILVAIFLAAYLVPAPLYAFELFVAFIQAVVFSMLTLFFIKLAIMEPHGDEAH